MSSVFHPMGRTLVWLGIALIVAGSVLQWAPNVPWLGKLPGDISIRRDGVGFYLPLTTCLLLGALLSLLLWLIGRFR